MNNVTMNNITANSGTFTGLINATQGLCLPCSNSSAQTDYLESKIVFHRNTFFVSETVAHKYTTTIMLPPNPNQGQQLTIRFVGNTWHKCLGGNGHPIEESKTGFLYFFVFFYPGYDYGDDGQAEDSYQITNGWVTVIYDGSVWRIASLLKFENYLSQKFNF